ncbi:MAG: CHAT domain-containing protein [Oscillatoria princeps RMCB-10]|jgi:CHAT domain-containing protein|nr:CHAT domain-containing protein [Oscillatoria princeps RMCB-10]
MALGAKALSQNPTGTQLVQQGTSLYEAGKFQEAATVWQQAASAFQKQGDTLNQAMALSNLSLTYQQVGEWQKATQSIEESLKLLPASQGASAEELRVIAQTRDIEGNLQLAVGQAEKALATWQQTASIYDKLGWEEGKNQSWLNQARALQDLGLYPRAGETLLQIFGSDFTRVSKLSKEEANSWLQEFSDSPSPIKAVALRSLGDILRQLGNLDLSQTVLERSLSWAETPQDKIAVKLSLGNTERALAGRERDRLDEIDVSYIAGLYNQAFKQAFQAYEEVAGESPAPLTRIQARLADLNLLLEIKKWGEKQRDKFTQDAREDWAKIESALIDNAKALLPDIQSDFAGLSSSRAAVYARIDFARSLQNLPDVGQASRLSQNLPDVVCTGETPVPTPECRLFPNAGQAFPPTQNLPDAGQTLNRAVEMAKNLGDKRAEAYALGYLGEWYEKQGMISSAKNNTESAKNNTEPAKNLTQKALELLLKDNSRDNREIAYRWQWQLGRILKTEGDSKGALAAYAEAFNTLQSLRQDLAGINRDAQFSFQEEVEPVYRDLVGLLLQSELSPEDLKPLVLLLNSSRNQESEPISETSPNPGELAQRVFEALQVAELDNYFRDPCAEVVPVRIGDFLNKEARNSAVIYPIILGNRLEILLQLPDKRLLHHTAELPQDYREVLDTLYRTLSQEAKAIVITKYTSEERAEKFANNTQKLLPILQQVHSWLIQPIEKYLASVSGVNTLVFVLDGPFQNIPIAALHDGEKYLVEKYSVALTPGLQLLDPKPLPREDLKVLAAGLSKENEDGKDPLPGVGEELNTIERDLGREKVIKLLNEDFTQKKLENLVKSGSFPVVHIASHGQFSSNPEKTIIDAWEPKKIGFNEFNKLLKTGDKAIELLVLSACETAKGDRRAVLGLAGVAVRAGARSTLATLWQVEDKSAKDLMVKFYQELARDKVTKAEALNRAQLTLLQDNNYNHPVYWAPYVLVGNWL